MVPRVSRGGRSFAGAWKYYAHDRRTPEQAEEGEQVRTRERVGFVHTENLCGIEDDRAAIGFMIFTAEQNTRCKQPVYAFSLAWHPEEQPSREAMIEAGQEALKVLKMEEHQALLISHTDTAHPHIHIIVNRIHPETGKAVSLSHDHRKLSTWAQAYEQKRGKVYCQARQFNAQARAVAKEQDGKPAPRRYVDDTVAASWARSQNGNDLRAALSAKGWGLAKGDKKEAVLMAVAPNGRAFSILRELNKGLDKTQKIKAQDFDRRMSDLKRDKLPSVREVQQSMQRRKSGEQSRQHTPATGKKPEGQKQPDPDEGRTWALEMRIRAEHRGLEARQEEARKHQQQAAKERLEKAQQDAMQAQHIAEQKKELREARERIEKGGLGYRMSGQARQDRATAQELPKQLEQSMQHVENWITRERGKVAEAFKAFDQKQANERRELERKIEYAREAGAWPETKRRQDTQEPQRQPEPSPQKQQSQGPPQGRSRGRER
ncbi:MAG: relaxase/mobilization nuclease domain-containing protein [Candidatus Competibacteraceae bacterium]|nr:relaxase/mobilization nuclease domain-containing protein [Candidatus Competibacteraceae bacterium]